MTSTIFNRSLVNVLFSGGIDSTALIHYYKSKNNQVSATHIQYGQGNSQSELEAVKYISSYYEIQTNIIHLGLNLKMRHEEFLCRNAIFVLTTAATVPAKLGRIALGIHQGTNYYDCSSVFMQDCQRLLDGYFFGKVILEAPFIEFTKLQIIEYCKLHEIPLNRTYSCEISDIPCGHCLSCKDRRNI